MTQTDFIGRLQANVGADIVLRAADANLDRHSRDFLNVMRDDVAILGVAYPRTAEQVSAILVACQADEVPVVPQGGLTSMVGGPVPTRSSLVLSLDRMRAIEEIDEAAGTMTVQAGCILEMVQRSADEAGFFFPLDLGGRGSAQVGGLISTNAGGNRVLRYGMMRESVLGIEAVLPDGTIIHSLNKMLKNNAGYDLKQLFIGAEGTLGVITRAVLRLYPKPLSTNTALLAVADYTRLLALLQRTKTAFGGELGAFEAMWPDMYRLGTVALDRQPPIAIGHGLYILIETLGTDPERSPVQFEEVLGSMIEDGLAEDIVIAASERQRQDMWAIRDCPGEFSKMFWPQRSYDISLPTGAIGDFVTRCTAALRERWPGIGTAFWGHIADSNLHLSLNLPDPDGAALDKAVYEFTGAYGGSISAEHGIGSMKRAYLHYSRTPEEIATMRLLKHAFDPKGIMNPDKVI
jgi:FAD/FMN-containing dehydrogenase